MKKTTLLEKTTAPDGSSVTLDEHDGRYTIRVNGLDLMSTRQHASEEKLAEIGCSGLLTKKNARVLIGGLGFGFTLRATLKSLAPDAKVVVAELLPAVVEWNRNPKYPLAAEPMADKRVEIVLKDVADIIAESRAGFNAILIDVDNGPAALSTHGNWRLYDANGLKLIREALRPQGCVAFWSSAQDPLFGKRFAGAGLKLEVVQTRAHTTSGGLHTLYIGRVN